MSAPFREEWSGKNARYQKLNKGTLPIYGRGLLYSDVLLLQFAGVFPERLSITSDSGLVELIDL